MNYLAHQFLSFQNTDIQLGNLYGEIVRGKDFENYQGDIQKGILLHRAIDTFTDGHEIVKKSSKKFHDQYGKFSPIIIDVVYDYYLIQNWKTFTNLDFEQFVQNCYTLFHQELPKFPEKLQFIVSHLLRYDWFHNYASFEGIEETLRGIKNRSKFDNQIDLAIREIERFDKELNEEFLEFFPELMQHCKEFVYK